MGVEHFGDLDLTLSQVEITQINRLKSINFKIEGSKERLNIEKDLNIKIPSLKLIWDKLPDVTINIKEIKLINFSADYNIEVEANVYN